MTTVPCDGQIAHVLIDPKIEGPSADAGFASFAENLQGDLQGICKDMQASCIEDDWQMSTILFSFWDHMKALKVEVAKGSM